MFKRLVLFLITSGLAAQALRHLGSKRQQRIARTEHRLDKMATQRWEDEGGSPATPSQPA